MTARYDRKSIALHWATAFLVLWQWGQAHVIDLVTTGGTPGRRAMISLHVLGGVLLLAVLLVRLYWRHTGGQRLPQPAGALGLAAKAGHIAIYALLAAVLVAGLWFEWVRGDNLFGVFQIPAYDPGNRALRASAKGLHETLANAMLIVAGLHTLAALAHHYVLRDGILARMLPWVTPRSSNR